MSRSIPTWFILIIVLVVGAFGGIANSLLGDKSLRLPEKIRRDDGSIIIVPGFWGNAFLGAVAALTSWSLYGPWSTMLLGSAGNITAATLGGALLTGAAGAGWISNAVNTSLMRITAINAAEAQSNPEAASQIKSVHPRDALSISQEMP